MIKDLYPFNRGFTCCLIRLCSLIFFFPLIKKSQVRFLDTMSLHIALCGMTSFQQVLYQSSKKSTNRKDVREYMEMKSSRKQMVMSLKVLLTFTSHVLPCKLNIVTRSVFALLSKKYNTITSVRICRCFSKRPFNVIYIGKQTKLREIH